MSWWTLLDFVATKSGAKESIGERIEQKDGEESGEANRRGQLLLIGWTIFAVYIYYISNVQSDPSGAGAISTVSILCPFIPLLLITSIYMMWLLSD